MNIVPASGDRIEMVRTLWREYWAALGLPGDFQNFNAELAVLPGVYTPPEGRLLLAMAGDEPAGTIALRRIDERSCEAKRLYVRQSHRRRGIGRSLLCRVIEEARTAGYREMYGDTLESMTSALEMYRRIGFCEVPPYAANPTPGAIYLRLAL